MKNKITISISEVLLNQIDKKIDKKRFKNRSSVIEYLIRKGLNLKDDIGSIILAHDDNWEDGVYSLDYPKVLIKVDTKTLLEKHLENLEKANIKKVLISIGHKKEQIKEFLKNKKFKLEIIFLEVDKDLLNLPVISKARKILNTNKVLIILGDNYFYPLDLLDFINYHNENKSELSIIVKSILNSNNFGNIRIRGNNIVEFTERPRDSDGLSNLINTGIYLMDSSKIPDTTKNLKIESDFFPDFVQKAKTKAYFHNGKYFHLQDNETLKLFTK